MKSLREGQLNQVEQWKLQRHPLDVYDAIVTRYAREGAAAIDAVPGEQERLKWVGIYPQRQGGDNFMLRVKVPGGRLNAAQTAVLGAIADEFARGPEPNPVFGDAYADITTRQDIQLHWLKIADIPGIWKRLEDVGMTTLQACGDSARNVLCCPVSGIDADEVLDAYPVAAAVSDYFTGNREYANLPRKFKLSVTGCREDCAQAEINDIGLWPARQADGTLGYNVLVGGGLSDGPRMASDIDVFVGNDPGAAVEVLRAIAQVFGELGNRTNRGLSRMRYLVQELGPERFRAEVAARSEVALAPAGEALTRRYRGDHVGVHPQREPGLVYVGLSVPVGRILGTDLVEVARLAGTYGDGGVRLATDQNLIITGVPEGRVDELLAEPLLARYSPSPGPFERGVVACTGTEFCRFAIVETKARAVEWARHLDGVIAREGETGAGVGSGDGPDVIRMHFSGCSASCAQPQIADIGFRGETAHVGEDGAAGGDGGGRIVEGVDIGLGGSLGLDAGFIDFVEGAKPVDEVPEALAGLVRAYLADRREGERFHEWCRRTPRTELRATLGGGV
jgi:ferredoxin-nitrite reductase